MLIQEETTTNKPTRQEVHTKRHRRLPVGAEVFPAGGVHSGLGFTPPACGSAA